MRRTVATSSTYQEWLQQAAAADETITRAIGEDDFTSLGVAAEANAIAMHATMKTADPPILYWEPATVEVIQEVTALRGDGLEVYFSIDAGANVMLLFEADTSSQLLERWPEMQVVSPFDG